MFIGDFLILFVDLIFIFMTWYSINYYGKYKNDSTIKLDEIEIMNIKKMYYSTFILFFMAPIFYVVLANRPSIEAACERGGRCLKAHEVSWAVVSNVISAASIFINRYSKKMLTLFKKREELQASK